MLTVCLCYCRERALLCYVCVDASCRSGLRDDGIMESFINPKKPPSPLSGRCLPWKFWLRLHTLTGYSLRSGQARFIQVTVTSAEVKDAAAARPFGLSAPDS